MSLVLIISLTCVACYFIHAKWAIFTVGRRIRGPWALPLVGNAQMISKLKPECKCFIEDIKKNHKICVLTLRKHIKENIFYKFNFYAFKLSS